MTCDTWSALEKALIDWMEGHTGPIITEGKLLIARAEGEALMAQAYARENALAAARWREMERSFPCISGMIRDRVVTPD